MSRKRQGVICPPISPRRFQVLTLAFEFASGHVIPFHEHDWHQLVYAIKGVMTVETFAGLWIVPPHRALWMPAATQHSIRISGAASMRTLYFWPRLSTSFPNVCRVIAVSPLLRELIVFATGRKTLNRRARADGQLIGVILEQLRSIPVDALHLPEPQDARAQKLARLLHDDPSDRRSPDHIAELGASKRTIERVFRTETGMTLGKWRQQVRLLHALRLLALRRKVTAVALEVGYDSPSAFISAFRRTFGKTPSRYFEP
ncbi:MAG: helix-turn-helix transcriptional regulator [Planctomycetes bacterium]|nr:helix-turn-helix transcriptional regulator [Planctomycetota bacterium]